jgi:hypothetical protein
MRRGGLIQDFPLPGCWLNLQPNVPRSATPKTDLTHQVIDLQADQNLEAADPPIAAPARMQGQYTIEVIVASGLVDNRCMGRRSASKPRPSGLDRENSTVHVSLPGTLIGVLAILREQKWI